MTALVAAALVCVGTPCAIENVKVEVGDGTVLERTTVVISGGRIAGVGPAVAVPPGATRFDGTGKVLTPGLVEARTQLGIVEIQAEKATVDSSLGGADLAPGFRAADGFNPLSVHIPIGREEGVTSAVTGPVGGILSGTGSWFDLTSKLSSIPDPARPVAMFGAVGNGASQLAGRARGGLWLKLREAIADARYWRSNRAAVDQNRARVLSLPPLHLEALQPVLDGKIPLVLEANRTSDILAALELARAERLEIAILGGAEAWRVADRLASARVPVIVTPSEQAPSSFESLAARDDGPALLDRAGVPLVISTASWDQNVRRLRQEAGLAVAHGLARNRALRAITLAPADLYGKGGEVGTIAPGKRANVVLWSGDPLELSTVAERVLVDGEELPLDTRQRRLVERYRAR